MDTLWPLSSNLVKFSIDIICYSLIALTSYYYVLKPVSNLLYQIYYAHRFHYIPGHFIFGHLRYLIPKFPTPNYDLMDATKNFYRLMIESNDPIKGANIAIIWIGWYPFYTVSGPKEIEAVLNKSNLTKPYFYKFLSLRDGLIPGDPDVWRPRRKIIEPFFRTKNHQYFVSVMNKEISKISDQIAQKTGQPYDIERLIHTSSMNIILDVTWGIPCDELHDLKLFYLDILDISERYFTQRIFNPLYRYDRIFNLFEDGKKFQQNTNKITEGLKFAEIKAQEYAKISSEANTTNNQEASKESGCLYKFLKAYNETGKVQIDDNAISTEVLNIASAGNETIAIGMRWTLFILGNHPEIQERLYQEVADTFPDDSPVDDSDKIGQCKYLDQCLKESLRLIPPVHGVARQLDEDVVINGAKIFKNSLVIINFSSTHYDPKLFPNPKTYDPDRWSTESGQTLPKGAFVPFGLGPRICIGYRYALMEMKIYLIHIIRRFNFKSVRKLNDVGYRFELTLKPTCPLEIIFTPRV